MDNVTVEIKRLHPEKDSDIALPQYETADSAGMDVRAAIEKECTIAPGEIVLLPTGFAMAIPSGFEIQVRPRSGLAIKHGITLINSPGTIDADYRGEVKVGLVNLGREPFVVRRGDRIAQMILAPVTQVRWQEVTQLNETLRGDGGFGSTGMV